MDDIVFTYTWNFLQPPPQPQYQPPPPPSPPPPPKQESAVTITEPSSAASMASSAHVSFEKDVVAPQGHDPEMIHKESVHPDLWTDPTDSKNFEKFQWHLANDLQAAYDAFIDMLRLILILGLKLR